jgi:hypothetical protein
MTPQEKAGHATGLSIVAVVHPVGQMNAARVPGTAQSNWWASPNVAVSVRSAKARRSKHRRLEKHAGKAGMKEDEVVLVDDGACPKG